jgi:phage terminase large subunit-like protein
MTYSLRDFVRFCSKLRTENGKPLRLQPFQKRLLRGYFDGIRETVIVLPTGNGKTTLLAALAVYHMLRVPNASVIIVAAAMEQASQMFKQARTLLADSPYADLLAVQAGTYRIFHAGTPRDRVPGEIRVIASEVSKQEGAIPTLVLMDELHAHPDFRMYEMLRDKLWKRHLEIGCGRMITISTAGFSFESPLYKLKERVETLPSFGRAGVYNHATAPGFEWHEYALGPDADLEDFDVVWKVNPAPWVTKASLRQRWLTPTMSIGEWARSACNVWTAGAEPEILPKDWDPLRADIGAIVDGDQVVLAPSVGRNAVIGIASMRPDDKVAVRAEHVQANGRSIHEQTEDAIVALCDRYDVEQVLDPGYGMQRSMELVEARGVPVVPQAYSTPRQIAATAAFDRYLKGRNLIHDGDPQTRAQILSAIKKPGTNGEHYVASDESRAITAISMAVFAVTAISPAPKIHIYKGA